MQLTEDMAAWFADRPRRDASAARGEAIARWWSGHAIGRDLRERLAGLHPPTAAAVLNAANDFMARTDVIEELIGRCVAEAADPFFQPPLITLQTDIARGLLLHDDRFVSITLALTRIEALSAKKTSVRGGTSILFNGQHSLFHFLRSGGATLSLWEAPSPASAADSCRLIERRKIEDGEQMRLDGARQSFVIEHAETDMLCIQASAKVDAAPLSVEFDSKTLRYVGASSGEEGSSRLEMMVSLLRTMDRADAAPVMAQLIAGSPHQTRWYIMRELLALDCDVGLPVLRSLADSDPHPEVREAAQQTIAMFFPDQPAEEAA